MRIRPPFPHQPSRYRLSYSRAGAEQPEVRARPKPPPSGRSRNQPARREMTGASATRHPLDDLLHSFKAPAANVLGKQKMRKQETQHPKKCAVKLREGLGSN